MTTPAVNDVTTLNIPYECFIVEKKFIGTACASTTVSSEGFPISAVGVTRRNASISTRPWTKFGFRPPTPWYRVSGRLELPLVIWTRADTFFDRCGVYNWYDRSSTWTFGPVNNILMVGAFADSNLPFSSALSNSCDIALLNKMKDDDANLGQMLLERKETEHLLVDVLRKIAKSIQNVKQIRRRGMKAVYDAYRRTGARGNEIPSWWLEMQYGWKPLMSDVHQAMKVVDMHQQANHYRIWKEVQMRSGASPVTWGFRDKYNNSVVWMTSEMRELCRVRCDYELQTSVMGTLASVGLANPLNLAWERTPFSFVLDWFWPLGQWFNTFDAHCGKAFLAGTRTKVVRSGGPVHWSTVPDFYTTASLPSGGVFRAYHMQRDVLHSFPSPSLPAFKNPCSPVHVANALSLLATALFSGVPQHLRR